MVRQQTRGASQKERLTRTVAYGIWTTANKVRAVALLTILYKRHMLTKENDHGYQCRL